MRTVALMATVLLSCTPPAALPSPPCAHAISVGTNDDGDPVYLVDGHMHVELTRSGGLVAAVHDDPEALRAARRAHSQHFYSAMFTTAAMVCGAGATAFVTGDAISGSVDQPILEASLVVCAVAGFIGGYRFSDAASINQFRAVSLYNTHRCHDEPSP